jgi:hypothetical protein
LETARQNKKKEYFVSHKMILLCTLLPEINVRGNISVTNWKELNPESTENVRNTVVV